MAQGSFDHDELSNVAFQIANSLPISSADTLSSGQRDNLTSLQPRHDRIQELLMTSLWTPLVNREEISSPVQEQIGKVQGGLEMLLRLKINQASLRINEEGADRSWILERLLDGESLDIFISMLEELDEKWTQSRSCQSVSKGATTGTEELEPNLHTTERASGRDADGFKDKTIEHPYPTIDHKVFNGETSTQKKIARLFDLLHSHFPCRDKNHTERDHERKLGKSTEARLCLEPGWNVDRQVDSFTVILKGEGLAQECRIVTDARYKTTLSPLCTMFPSRNPPRPDCYELVIENASTLRVWRQKRATLCGNGIREMSLRELIDTGPIQVNSKSLLSLVLVRALLHLLGSKWVCQPLNIDNIFLSYSQIDGARKVQFDKIFLPTMFRSSSARELGQSEETYFATRPLEPLSDLAIVLAQLELSDHLPRLNKEISFDTMESEGQSHIVEQILLAECKKWCSSLPSTIKFCFETLSLDKYDDLEPDELLSDRDFVMTYYSQIIRPIEDRLIQMDWKWKQVSWEEPPVNSDIHGTSCLFGTLSKGPKQKAQGPIPNPMPSLHYNPLQDPEEEVRISWSGQPLGRVMDYTFDSDLAAQRADDWMQQLMNRYEYLYRPVDVGRLDEERIPKVAIIDTGCDLEHDEIRPYVESNTIADFHDFVENKEGQIVDLDGHGTHVSHLLLQAARHVRLYIGRAFKTAKADENTAQYVSQAIRRAVDTWKVDIISLSFAFEDEDSNIRSAISYAISQRVLIFAAASNKSANNRRSRGYPARELGVICVHSTDDQGCRSRFSPRGEDRSMNFAILGENLQAAWPTLLNQGGGNLKRVTGTSQATPILAGIAATILHISRLKQYGPVKKETEEKLKQARYMERVLYECMTDKCPAPGYNYIKPSKLFDQTIELRNIIPAICIALWNS